MLAHYVLGHNDYELDAALLVEDCLIVAGVFSMSKSKSDSLLLLSLFSLLLTGASLEGNLQLLR